MRRVQLAKGLLVRVVLPVQQTEESRRGQVQAVEVQLRAQEGEKQQQKE